MRVIKTIPAGQQGSGKYVNTWGNKLLNVRYREDEARGEIVTTVEIVVDSRPKPKQGSQQRGYLARRDQTPVSLRIDFHEEELRATVKSRGGRWDQHRKLWILNRGQAVALGLRDRIIKTTPPNTSDFVITESTRDA